MTDLAASTAIRRRPAWLRPSWAALLALVAAASGTGAFAMASMPAGASGYDGHLALLLRFMAILKAATVLGAVGLASWRFRTPIAAATAFLYIGAVALMAVAPGLIWSLRHIALGAVCFHVGLLAYLVTALRDDAVGLMLRKDRLLRKDRR